MKKNARGSFQPRAGGSLVTSLFSRIGKAGEARDYRAMHAWHRLAGPRLGRHTRPERVTRSTLFVRVATAGWANELSYMRAGLLEKLRGAPGAEWIEELRFTIGPLDELPAWEDEPEDLRPPPPPPPPRPAVDSGAVAGALLSVVDPELRAALAELFARANASR